MKKTRNLTTAAVIAALYVALTLLQNLIFPESTSFMIQFRASEALCALALFTPAAIPGLTIGCLLYNFLNAGALPLDFFLGSAATLLATSLMYWLRRLRVAKLPLVQLLMPALCNGILVGCELTIYLGQMPLLMNMACVAAGELAVLLTLGLGLYLLLTNRRLNRVLFG